MAQRSIIATAVLVAAAGCFALSAAAEQTQKKGAAATPSAAEPRRDPRGITGISPFWSAIVRGDSAYVARDFDAAVSAFREAITSEPQNPLGHLRMGEAQRAKGDLQEAERSFSAALRFSGNAPEHRAKALFLLADLSESQRQFQVAKDRWNAYIDLAGQSPQVRTFADNAAERIRRIEKWQQLETEYAAVKQRIDKRLQEADKKARDSAK
jgi:tetratricopeptide (TPR) repeat protein